MNKIFDTVAVKTPQKSAFDKSHERKQTQQFGVLTPCFLEEVIPSDEYSVKTETLIRMQPMIAPIMERVDLYIHYFFIPSRLLWTEWEDFVTGGDKGDLAPVTPKVSLSNAARAGTKTLADYLGLPTNDDVADPFLAPLTVSQLPFRAYHLIWNEYYRDEQLQEKFNIEDSATAEFFQLRSRAWGKDYFTSSLPNAQKGPAVTVPVEGTGSVTYKTTSNVYASDGSQPLTGVGLHVDPLLDTSLAIPGGTPTTARIENIDEVTLDQVGLTIEELRRSSRLQEWLELANRGGSRLVELIKNYFGVHSGDARLQRPEYLGGGKTPIMISEVLNTTGVLDSGAPLGVPQGTMAGHGIATNANNSFKYKVKEHGYIMGISSILPQATYSQGVNRLWTREDRFDLYWPQFANIGEQAVKNNELFHDYNDDTSNDLTFGYQQQYAEFKYACNTVHGEFRTSLAFWTLARKFANQPNLTEEFIICDDPNLQDIFAVIDPTIDKFLVQMYHNVKARRPMPYFSFPEL